MNPSHIPVAVRVYPDNPAKKQTKSAKPTWHRPESMLVFDTETTIDATQRLLFGAYRFIVQGECREEGLFYADDLAAEDLEILRRYVAKYRADTADPTELTLLSRSEFLKKLFQAGYKGRSLIVGFNLPFDLSRIGFDVTSARREFNGGFSLGLWSYVDRKGQEYPDPNRPRVTIKHIDSKRSLISFTGRRLPDRDDQIPEGSKDGQPQEGYRFRGNFLDLKTLSFALTDRGHSLKSANEAFGVERGKTEVSEHGIVTEKYITYNRRDVEATWRLAEKLLQEYELHPISLPETKAFSPASLGKDYLRTMGITPISTRQKNLQPYIGYAQTAFFGGRASAHIRKVPVPVVYTDFLSMYPTVNSLMDLWQLVIARKIKIVEHCQREITDFLKQLTQDRLFQPETWKQLRAFVRLIPDGDILPTRGQYSSASNDWQVGINHLYASSPEEKDALWFSLPDVVASVILTGRIPKIVDAFRIEASGGILKGLKPTRLRGRVEIDPAQQDFFKTAIEERKRLSARKDLSPADRERLDRALKVLANSTSYGIYAQMDPVENDQAMVVTCHGLDAAPYKTSVSNSERPGEFCFPPLASLITGGARLMLALLEKCVTDLGGTYAMEDTDSMAIVATESGGLVPCPGGPFKLRKSPQAVRALSWAQVREISKRFESLNPYDRTAVPGSILKIEHDNFDPITKTQRQLWCVAISAKRYGLFLKNKSGQPSLLRKDKNSKDNHWSEHGLGHLLNPVDLNSDDREWTAQVWQNIICNCLNIPAEKVKFENIPAIGRVTITSPGILQPLSALNREKKYSDQIKPFNFLLTGHISPFGHPIGANPEKFHLIAPFELNSKNWLKMPWIDQYSGKKFNITTEKNYSSRSTARVKTYADVFAEYAHHPESKCADERGNTCDRQTIGLLYRRHIRVGEIVCVGKESNKLEEVDAALIHSAESVYTVYSDPKRDSWEKIIRPKLQTIPLSVLIKETALSRRMLIKARNGQVRPHGRNQRRIADAVNKFFGEPQKIPDSFGGRVK